MATQILMPALSPTMEEGTLAKWLVKEGDTVQSGDLLAEIETDKATMEFEAVDEGIVGKLLVDEGALVKVNAPIAVLVEEGESVGDVEAPAAPAAASAPVDAPAEAAKPAPQVSAAPADKGTRIFASPLARRIAADKGLDLATIAGSGPRGRIVKADVEAARPAQATAPAAAAPAPTLPAGPGADAVLAAYADRDYTEITLDGMRKTIAARLTAPHRGQADDPAFLPAPRHPPRRPARLPRADQRPACAARGEALGQRLHHQGLCAGTPDRARRQRGLGRRPGVATEAVRCRRGGVGRWRAVHPGDPRCRNEAAFRPLDGDESSFAISNLGMFGIDNFDAVINPPHGAILAVGAGVKKPVVDENGELAVATVMSVTLSVDHRVIDGALGAELLAAIRDNLENPLAMLA